jgi:hypothetical protein
LTADVTQDVDGKKNKYWTKMESVMRTQVIWTVATVLVLGMPLSLLACSGVTVVMNGKVVVGGNADTSFSQEMMLRITPNQDGSFGRMCISMETVPGWTPAAMKCMNDQGLVVTHANVPRDKTPYDPHKPQFRHNFLEKIVSECATVAQAISMVKAYSLPSQHNAFVHLMLADVSGDAAIIEWTAGETKVFRRTGSTLFMTNHFLSKPETAGGPNSRYNRGMRLLPHFQEASPSALIPLLKEISVGAKIKGEEVGTMNSTIWDITGRKLHLFYKRDFDHPLIFNLDEELAKGAHTIPLKDLFPNPIPFETAWRDENGPVDPKYVK